MILVGVWDLVFLLAVATAVGGACGMVSACALIGWLNQQER